MKRLIGTTLFLISFFLMAGVGSVFAAPLAYIDPNTGGMIFQILAVVFTMLSGVIFFFQSRIKMGFNRMMRRFRGTEEDDAADITGEMTQDTPPQA